MSQAVKNTAANQPFTYGDVLVWTKDFSVTFPGRDRKPGVHFLFMGYSDSGYCGIYFNTRTQRTDQFMNESWLVKHLRVLGNLTASTDESTEEDDA